MLKIAILLTLPAAALATRVALPLGLSLVFSFTLAATAAYLLHIALWRLIFHGPMP